MHSRIIHTRRQFLRTSAGIAAFSAAVPSSLASIASAAKARASERILVVVQLSGGNDGLNTVVPYADDVYYRNRFSLAYQKDNLLRVDDYLGLHPSLSGFAELLEQQQLAIIPGVGYPNPNRSHFESMDLWHTAHQVDRRSVGWLGQFADGIGDGTQPIAASIGQTNRPLAVTGLKAPVLAAASLDELKMQIAENDGARNAISGILSNYSSARNPALSFIGSEMQSAIHVSGLLSDRGNAGRSETKTEWPGGGLSDALRGVVSLIDSSMQMNVYYVTLDGFDTHASQRNAHAALLNQLSSSLSAFQQELNARGLADRVVTFAFSEFGRRVRENASQGTDHGAAAPSFLIGKDINAGVHGNYPSLTDLDDGDLKFTTDYRRIYATLLEKWFDTPSAPILGSSYEPLSVLG